MRAKGLLSCCIFRVFLIQLAIFVQRLPVHNLLGKFVPCKFCKSISIFYFMIVKFAFESWIDETEAMCSQTPYISEDSGHQSRPRSGHDRGCLSSGVYGNRVIPQILKHDILRQNMTQVTFYFSTKSRYLAYSYRVVDHLKMYSLYQARKFNKSISLFRCGRRMQIAGFVSGDDTLPGENFKR